MLTTLFASIYGGIVAFILAFALGANDVANALGTSVGSGALTLRNACIIAAIFEFSGAAFLGHLVSGTLKTGIVSPQDFGNTENFVLGMLCALTVSAIWLMIATFAALPVSTTQTIVGGIFGFAVVEVGFSAIKLSTISNIVLSWLVSPLIGGVFSYLIYLSINKLIFNTKQSPYDASLKLLPIYHSLTVVVAAGIILVTFQKIFDFSYWYALPFLLGVAIVTMVVSKILVVPYIQAKDEINRKKDVDAQINSGYDDGLLGELSEKEPDAIDVIVSQTTSLQYTEDKFKWLMVGSAIFVAFSHGANDVSNAVGPFSAIVDWVETGVVKDEAVPIYLVVLGGVAIVFGLATLGHKVMETIGQKIVKLTFSKGFSAQLGASLTVVIATIIGLPISTTSVLVGSITGVGLVQEKAKPGAGIDRAVLFKIVASWVVTFILGFTCTAALYYIAKTMVQP